MERGQDFLPKAPAETGKELWLVSGPFLPNTHLGLHRWGFLLFAQREDTCPWWPR